MICWIDEENPVLNHSSDDSFFKTPEDFFALMEQVTQDQLGQIASLVEGFTASEERFELEKLQERIREEHYFDPDMLLAAACAWQLVESPQLPTWIKVRKVVHHSWQIENWLSDAMRAYAKKNKNAKKAYIRLAKQLFNALENRELPSESQRTNESRERSWMHWQGTEYKLEELLYGLRGADFINYEDEWCFFGLLSEFDPESFQQLIASSDNPFLVDSALLRAGVGVFNPRFSQWKSCVKIAPSAFSEDGSWEKGAVLLPLLLVRARDQLLGPGRRIPRFEADESEVADLAGKVITLVQEVINVLSSREDAHVIFMRWSTWLMRQMLLRGKDDFNDIRSDNFIDDALLKAMGEAMHGKWKSIKFAPKDAAPWESWCFRCVCSHFADNGFTDMPSFDEFSKQWELSPEDWHKQKGRELLEQANLHLPRNQMPDLSANLLVLPLASQEGFASRWKQLWDGAYYLREVLEFGSEDDNKNTYRDQADASRLLLLLGCMGLACFHQVSVRLAETPSKSLAKEMISLHEVLAMATMDILHIDNTTGRDKWQALLRHLALCRVYWDKNYRVDSETLFTEDSEPTVRDYLICFQADPKNLIAFLYACIYNRLDVSKLRQELQDASIDLHASVEMQKRLHGFHEHKYPIDERAISAIKSLMVKSDSC